MAIKIKKASDNIEMVLIKELIYGEPGIGKTTLALTAPSPLLIDCDSGIRRVDAKHRTDYLQVASWEDIVQIFDSPDDIKSYDTIVIDTVGKAMDFLTAFLIKRDYKIGSKTGGLTLQGYGALLSEFRMFLGRIAQINKHVIFIAHDREFQDGEMVKFRPDIQGRSLGSILREMDLVGYMQSRNGQRTISYTPNDRFYGKNTCKLADVISVEDLEVTNGKPMTAIFEQYKINLEKQSEVLGHYNNLISAIEEKIRALLTIDEVREFSESIKTGEEIWDSKTIARIKFQEKIIELGIKWDKELKDFVN